MTSLAQWLNLIYDVRADVEKHKMLRSIISSTSLIESENHSNNKSIKDPINQLSTPSKDDFVVSLPVKLFNHDEIVVKVKKQQIIVEGQVERADDFGFVSRQFTRRLILPPHIDPRTIACYHDDDGKLTIKAKKTSDGPRDRLIPIQLESAASWNFMYFFTVTATFCRIIKWIVDDSQDVVQAIFRFLSLSGARSWKWLRNYHKAYL